MYKKLISIITATALAVLSLAIPCMVSADYEYTYTFTKHGFTETIFDGESVYELTKGGAMTLPMTDDYGNSIQAKDIAYMQLNYYHYLPDGVTSTFTGKSPQAQVTAGNMIVDGVASSTSYSGFVGFSGLSAVNEWASTGATEMTKIRQAVTDNPNTTSITIKGLWFNPAWNVADFAEGEKLYLKSFTIYAKNPGSTTAADNTSHTVNFYNDDTKTSLAASGTYGSNISAYADVITMPKPTVAKEGYSFGGWKHPVTGEVFAPGSSYSFTGGKALDFTGVWIAQEVYVSADGDDTAFGTADAPVKTLSRAMELLDAAQGGRIYIGGSVSYDDMPTHTAPVTFTAVRSGGTLTSDGDIKLVGPTKFENISIDKNVYTFANSLTVQNVNATSEISLGGDMTIGGNGVAPKNESATLSGGSYDNVYFGGVDAAYKYGTYTGSNTLTIDNSANVGTVYLGHSTTADQLWAGDVNLVINSGSVTSFSDSGRKIGWLAGAVQILANYGSEVGSVSLDVPRISHGVYEMYSTADGGLLPTATEGEFSVNDGKFAVATNRTTNDVYYSSDGILRVPAGKYDVSYSETEYYTYDAAADTITVNTAFAPDFDLLWRNDPQDKLFLGWTYEDGTAPLNKTELAAGSVLYANYTDFNLAGGGDFYIEDTEIRQGENENPALRFIVH